MFLVRLDVVGNDLQNKIPNSSHMLALHNFRDLVNSMEEYVNILPIMAFELAT